MSWSKVLEQLFRGTLTLKKQLSKGGSLTFKKVRWKFGPSKGFIPLPNVLFSPILFLKMKEKDAYLCLNMYLNAYFDFFIFLCISHRAVFFLAKNLHLLTRGCHFQFGALTFTLVQCFMELHICKCIQYALYMIYIHIQYTYILKFIKK